MKNKTMKVSAAILSAAIIFSGMNINVNAAAGVFSVLPSAGIGLGLSKSSNSLSAIVAASNKSVTVKVEDTVDVKAIAPATYVMGATDEKAADETEEFENLVIAQVDSYVNVRSLPSEDSEIIGKLYDNSVGEFISEENGWYAITSGNVTGYVKAEYCVTGEDAIALAKEVGTTIATVDTTTLYVREEPSTEASILGAVPGGDQLEVVEETDGWLKVNIEEGDGYISADYVTVATEFVKAESKAEEEARLAKEAAARKAAQDAANKKAAASQSTTTTTTTTQSTTTVASDGTMGAEVANFACQFVGNPYVWGGTSLTEGADCSGFVMSVYANFGIELPHSSSADRNVGYGIATLDEAIPGDILCYSGHVAIYIGNGQIVHASTSKTGIIISSATYRNILSIRRIF